MARRSAPALGIGADDATPLGRTSVRDALDSAVIALEAAGCDSPRLDAELLLAHVLGVGRASLISGARARPRA